jgi:hypothetical protein
MADWEEYLSTEILRRVRSELSNLSFTRLVWLTENFDRTVAPFLRGDFDVHMKGEVPQMPLREIDAETYMMERDFRKPSDSP